jgi:hypothetical protein
MANQPDRPRRPLPKADEAAAQLVAARAKELREKRQSLSAGLPPLDHPAPTKRWPTPVTHSSSI